MGDVNFLEGIPTILPSFHLNFQFFKDAESPVEKDEENDPDVPDEKDETAGVARDETSQRCWPP